MKSDINSIKIIGRRRPAADPAAANAFLGTVLGLRRGRPFMPRGVYRFKSFDEAQQWSIRMMARRANRDRQP